jgi:hypothetical protein
MTSPDMTHAVRFDLSQGTVSHGDGSSVVVSAKAFADLIGAVSADVRARIASDLGSAMGTRIQKRSGGEQGVRSASLETVVSNLSAELAVSGFGTLTLERWGRAMVLHLTHSPVDAPDFLAVLVTSAISSSTRAAAFSTVLSKQDGVRVLIASQSAAQRVRKWLDEGVSWGDAVTRLQGGAS